MKLKYNFYILLDYFGYVLYEYFIYFFVLNLRTKKKIHNLLRTVNKICFIKMHKWKYFEFRKLIHHIIKLE